MAITIKNLASGDVSATPETVVLESSLATSVIIKSIIIVNPGSSAQTFHLKVTKMNGAVNAGSCYIAPAASSVPGYGRITVNFDVYLSWDGTHNNELRLWGGPLKYIINGMERDN